MSANVKDRSGSEVHSCAADVRLPVSPWPGWFVLGLAGVCAYVIVSQLLILREAWRANPLAAAPLVDAMEYWAWAGRVASGGPTDKLPFLSAPLYPYFVGLIRLLGGGLLSLYVVQAVLHVSSVLLIAYIATRKFDCVVGLAAAAVFSLLTDPAFFVGRVLNCSLQLFLVCLLWIQLNVATSRPSVWRWVVAGLLVGLNCLANPPMLILLIGLGPWAWWHGSRGWNGLRYAVPAVLAGLVVVSPATIHNYRACGEFIPISAQAGLTFYHGNNPWADGTYCPPPGMSINRSLQHADAQRIYRESTGSAGTWRQVDRFFQRKGLDYWTSDPSRAVKLEGRKFYWFVTGKHYGDIYMPALEAEEGLSHWLSLTPLPVAWLVPTALLACFYSDRRYRSHLSDWVLLAIPLAVVLLFFYYPRYRLPCVPVIVVLASWAVREGLRSPIRWPRLVTVAASIALAWGLDIANRAVGFDSPGVYRAGFRYNLGLAESHLGRREAAIGWFRKVLEIDPAYADAEFSLGGELCESGRRGEGVEHLRRAVMLRADDPRYRNALGYYLVKMGAKEEAVEQFREAVRLNPEAPEYRYSLATGLLEKGAVSEAIAEYEAVLRADPRVAMPHLNLGLAYARQGRLDAALAQYSEALKLDPTLALAHYQSADIFLARGQLRAGVEALRLAHEAAPDNLLYLNSLAWWLATAPFEELRNPASSLALAREAQQRMGGKDPLTAVTLAAALAANGQFADAAQIARTALPLAEQQNRAEVAAMLREHLALYESGRPFVQERLEQNAPAAPDR